MGKMTDALRKARLLKEQREKGERHAPSESERSLPPAAPAVPGPDAERVWTGPTQAPGEEPHVGPSAAAPPKPEDMPLHPPREAGRPGPEGQAVLAAEPTVEASAESESTPTAPAVLPDLEPESGPVAVEAPARETILPDLEPTPVETATPYLSAHFQKDGRTADEFRRLKNQLTAPGSSARVILVTSCVGGEGKTVLAANLAVSFANTYGERVVLVDGNTVRPKIGELLNLPEEGLVQVARGHLRPEDGIVKTDIPGLWALSAGRPDGRSEGLLDSKSVAELLNWLRGRFTRVIMELPPIGDAAEGLALLGHADVVLIPVMKSRTRRKALRRVLAKIGDLGPGKLRCVFVKA